MSAPVHPAATSAPAEPPRAARRSSRYPLTIATGAVVVVGVVVALARSYHPIGDHALPELFVRQIPHRLPLVGPYSINRGFSHPGPWYFYLAAVPYLLSGERSASLLATALLVNGGALTGAVAIAERRRAPGLAVLLVAAVALTAFGHDPWFLTVPWNPYLAAIPFITLVVATWALVSGGSRWLLVAIALLGSWCIGSHMGFGVPVVAVWSAAAVGVGLRIHRHDATAHDLRPPMLVSLGALALMWLPAIVDLATAGRDSNAAGIWRFVTDPPVGAVPIRDAVSLLSSELSLRPYWAGGARPTAALGIDGHFAWPLFVVPVLIAFVWAHRRGARAETSGLVVALVALAGGFVGAALTHATELLSWYAMPAEMAGITVTAFTIWSLARSVDAHVGAKRARMVRTLTIGCGVIAVAALAVRVVRIAPLAINERIGAAVADVTPTLLGRLPADRPIVVDAPLLAHEALIGEVLALERAGRTVTVPPRLESQMGPWWARPAAPDAIHLELRAAEEPRPPGGRRVATTRPLPFLLVGDEPLVIWRVPARSEAP